MSVCCHAKSNLVFRISIVVACFFIFAPAKTSAEIIILHPIVDIWVSDASDRERNTRMGNAKRLKLKSIQEMAAFKFDTKSLLGKEIRSAKLFFHPIQANHQLRYIRASTINQDWTEGSSWFPGIIGGNVTYNRPNSTKSWAWTGSQFCDVTFSSGHSISCWNELEKEENGWISVKIDPRLIIAMTIGDSDGLAIMDGGTYQPFNNFVHSRKSGKFSPFMMVETGSDLKIIPKSQVLNVAAAPEQADFKSGAVSFEIENDPDVFYWRIKINDRLLDRWQVPHPQKGKNTKFFIQGLLPSQKSKIEITGVSVSGHVGSPAILQVVTSPALVTKLKLNKPVPPTLNHNQTIYKNKSFAAWAFPSLVKLSPLESVSLCDEMTGNSNYKLSNSVWDGKKINLSGIRGEFVDFQICVEILKDVLKEIKLIPGVLHGPNDSKIGPDEIEIFKNWYARTDRGIWQPAYTIPLEKKNTITIPDPQRGILNQANQTFSIDIYIPKHAAPGTHVGVFAILAGNNSKVNIPIQVHVHDLEMPDKLAFWPEMNAYSIPDNVHDYYRLAHQNRCVANFWSFRPKVRGAGKNTEVLWKEYDKLVGPLLDGTAFNNNRRKGYPIECLYLPYKDSWPTPLSKKNYHYEGYWPGKGESISHLIEHYLSSPYIGDGLSQSYKDAFTAVQKQFIEHFEKKAWNRTELQCFFGGKKSHRINHGSNMWWTTDEPYHWDDWLALQFFTRLWTKGREQMNAKKETWTARADISRPQWQGRTLEGSVDTVYYGGFIDSRTYKRCKILKEETGIKIRAYGAAVPHDQSNTKVVALVLNTWLNGADGFQTWWSKGTEKSLDQQEGTLGNALFVPGDRFDLPVIGDMRIKAFRKGEQLVEYLVLLSRKYNLSREQLRHMVNDFIDLNAYSRITSKADDADSLQFGSLKTWQIEGLRKEILKHL